MIRELVVTNAVGMTDLEFAVNVLTHIVKPLVQKVRASPRVQDVKFSLI